MREVASGGPEEGGLFELKRWMEGFGDWDWDPGVFGNFFIFGEVETGRSWIGGGLMASGLTLCW